MTAIIVFTRDLRVRDNPALVAACESSDAVVPLFVHDDRLPIAASGNRTRFLRESLDDLDRALRERGGRLVEARGSWVDTVARAAEALSASQIHAAADVSGYAQRRIERLRRACGTRVAIHTHDGVTVVAPGQVTPDGGESYKVFTPYYKRWLETGWRRPIDAPERIVLPDDADGAATRFDGGGRDGGEPASGDTAADLVPGGESAGLARLKAWARDDLAEYSERHHDLPADATSRISAYLHFGCLSPLEVASRLRSRPGGRAFVRQLCWRDFYHQVLHHRPDASTEDFRSRHDRWNDDADALDAWRTGQTGYPLVDAAMRQLAREGFMHKRARMAVASFLTKDLYIDWRLGAAHFMEHLVDGDVANNQLNWQWTAGTGTDTNPNRIFNPVRQGERFDPDGEYIRRHVPELADVAAPDVHWPDEALRRRCDYPLPIIDHRHAIAAYRVATTKR